MSSEVRIWVGKAWKFWKGEVVLLERIELCEHAI